MVIVISPRSLPSDQITREIVRAVESSKATFPLLLEVTHDDYARRRPGLAPGHGCGQRHAHSSGASGDRRAFARRGPRRQGIQAHANGRWATAEPPKQTTTVPQAILNSQLSASRAAAIVAKPATGVHSPTVATAAAPPASATTTAAAAAKQPPWTMIGIAAAVVVVAFVGWKFLHHPPTPPPAPAVTTATVMIRYTSDRHKCTPDLNVTIAGKAFHPTSNAFAASGVKSGRRNIRLTD